MSDRASRAPDNAKDSRSARSWNDGTVPRPGDASTKTVEDLAGSAPDIIHPHVPDDAIDQITADLAAFCIDRLEASVISGNEDHLSTSNLEDELQVRFKLQRVDKT